MKHVTVREALQAVADNPIPSDDEIQTRVHELLARSIYDIANRPEANKRGSLARANKARKILLERLVGRRRAGSHPATRTRVAVTFVDLTAGSIEQ